MPVKTLTRAVIPDLIEPDEWEHRITTSPHSRGHFTPDTMALQISIWGLPLALAVMGITLGRILTFATWGQVLSTASIFHLSANGERKSARDLAKLSQ